MTYTGVPTLPPRESAAFPFAIANSRCPELPTSASGLLGSASAKLSAIELIRCSSTLIWVSELRCTRRCATG